MNRSLLLLFSIILVSCGTQRTKQEENKRGVPVVSAVNYPTFYFALQIGGDLIRTEYPAPPDVDPAYWIPDDEALSIFQSSDLILANGAGYAKWMDHVSLPSSKIINTSSSARDKYIEIGEGISHSHGPGGEHEHIGYAFTTWLDFRIALIQAKSIKEALISKLPEEQQIIEENYALLEKEIISLHTNMQEVAAQFEGKTIIGSHPVYQYLAAAYNLDIQSVHFEPGEMPSEEQWKEFDHLLLYHPARIMIWEDEPMPEIRNALAEKGIEVVVFNPCGNKSQNTDFVDVMNNNILELLKAMGN